MVEIAASSPDGDCRRIDRERKGRFLPKDLFRYNLGMANDPIYPRLDESLLSHVPPFASLDREQIRTILDHATSRHFDEGTTVFEEGAEATRFFLLLDGYVRAVRYTAEGELVILAHIPPGQLFGIAQALQLNHYPATAVTASDSIVLSWPSTLFDDFKQRYKDFTTATYQTVGERLAERNDWAVALATARVEQRVARALVQLGRQSGRDVSDGVEIAFPVTRKDLSEMTATTLHTASRLLSAWEKDGIISGRRKHIVIQDQNRLQDLANAE